MGKIDAIDTLLQGKKRILFDSNCLIYLLESNSQYLELVELLFERIESGKVFGITSSIILTETLVRPIKNNDRQLVAKYNTFLAAFPNLFIVPVSIKVATRAAFIRAEYGLRTPDSIYIASGLLEGAEMFVTNDRQLKKFEDINTIILQEIIEEKMEL